MNEKQSEWQTESLTQAFLTGVRQAIPGAEMQFVVIDKLVRQWRPDADSILDLGCGDGILGRFLLNIFPGAHCVFLDFSDPMLDAARKELDGVSRASIVKEDYSQAQWIDAVASHRPFDIVISGFSIHHQPGEKKRRIYTEIYELLAPGGLFLNLEHVASQTPAVEQAYDEFFIDHLYNYHSKKDPTTKRDEIADNYYMRPDKNENILEPVEEQCAWLREIGFEDIDCFFKVFELALFGGRKE